MQTYAGKRVVVAGGGGTGMGASVARIVGELGGEVHILGVRHLTELMLPLIPSGGAVASISSAGGLGWPQRLSEVRELLETDGFDEGLAWVEQQTSGFLGEVFPTSYAFSKEAVIVYTMQRCVSSIAAGVRMNCTSPGATGTSMSPDFPAERVAVMVQPAGRKATP